MSPTVTSAKLLCLLQGSRSSTSIRSEALGAAITVGGGANRAAHPDYTEAEEFYRVLLDDTTAIWRADADQTLPRSSFTVRRDPHDSHGSPTGRSGAATQAYAPVNQAQLRVVRQSSRIQPNDLAMLSTIFQPGIPGELQSRLLAQQTPPGRRGVRKHLLRERMHAATYLNGGAHGTHGGLTAESRPGALVGGSASLSASRLRECSLDNSGRKSGIASSQLGPKTAALLEQVDSRSV